jgi:hypothetical protein
MTIGYDKEKYESYIEDIGVTMRTLLAVAAQGFAENGRRRWHVVYKNAKIAVVQVASIPRDAAID